MKLSSSYGRIIEPYFGLYGAKSRVWVKSHNSAKRCPICGQAVSKRYRKSHKNYHLITQ